MAASTYTIVPRTAFRAFLIAAIASIVGAGLLVLALTNAWSAAVAVIATVIMAAGLVLALLAWRSQRSSIAELVMNEDGYTVVNRDTSQSGEWADVTRVTRAVDGRQVTIFEGEEKRTRLQFNSDNRSQIDDILTEMGERLDAAKGYTPWDGAAG